MRHFKFKNLNPWGKKIEDCAVRAVSAALAMKYPAVCELFRKKCVPGTGMAGVEGIDLGLVKKRLGPFFDRVEDANDLEFDARPPEFADMEYDPEFDESPDLGFSLDEFCDAYAGTGRYMVAVVPATVWKGRNLYGHVVYADLRPGKGFFFDTWDCGNRTVLAYMKVKAILDPKDPRSLYYGRK